MSIAAEITETVYALTASNLGPFATGWTYVQASDVTAMLDTGTGVLAPLEQSVDYVLVGLTPTANGGAVTLSSSLMPLGAWGAGARLVIARTSTTATDTGWGSSDAFDPGTAEVSIDAVMRSVQELATARKRALLYQPGDSGSFLPPRALMKGMQLVGDPVTGDLSAAPPTNALTYDGVLLALGQSNVISVDNRWLPGDADMTNAWLRAAQAAAASGQPATIRCTNRTYAVRSTIRFTSPVLIEGDSRQGAVISRTGDYGPTFALGGVAAGVAYEIEGVGLKNLSFTDADSSMTVANSPYHVLCDYLRLVAWDDLSFLNGAGGLALLGCSNVRHARTTMRFQTGDPTGRIGFYVGATAVIGAASAHGGDIFGDGLTIDGGLDASAARLDYGIRIDTVDGFWLTNSHAIYARQAQLRLSQFGNSNQLTNVYIKNVMLDISLGNGLMIDGTGTLGVQAAQLELEISSAGEGVAAAHAIYRSGQTVGVSIKAAIRGYKGKPVYWGGDVGSGQSIDDHLDFTPGIIENATDSSDGFAITVGGMQRGTMQLGTVGGDGVWMGGIDVLATIASLTIVGGRLGEFQAGGPGVRIQAGFTGNLTVTGVDASAASVGLLDNSTGGVKNFVNCPGIGVLVTPYASLQGGAGVTILDSVAAPYLYLSVKGLIAGAFAAFASAVNYLTFEGAPAGVGPTLAANGADANIDVTIQPKGTGKINLTTTPVFPFDLVNAASDAAASAAGVPVHGLYRNGNSIQMRLV